MTSEQPTPDDAQPTAADLTQPDTADAAEPESADAAEPESADAVQPETQERWWWTGTYRAVLGGAVVGYQSPVLSSGEATPLNWVIAVVGAAVLVWGIGIVWTAYRARLAGQ